MASPSIADDSALVANLFQQLGGRIVEGESLQFDLKLKRDRRRGAKIKPVGCWCQKIAGVDHVGSYGCAQRCELVATRTPSDKIRGEMENSTLAKFGF